ncbi:MAG: sigma-70 family RNA polymerase sigma factor [Actinomycetota bacterium]
MANTSDPDIEELYRREGAKIWRALCAQTGDQELASDTLGEAFAQYLRRRDQVRDPSAWLWRASFKIAMGELQARRRTVSMSVEASYLMPEPARDLIVALSHLPPKQRAATVLHYFGGYSTKEIAPILGSSAATVRVHLSQGRRRLRTLLEENSDE